MKRKSRALNKQSHLKQVNSKFLARQVGWVLLSVTFVYILSCRIQVFEVSDNISTVEFFRNASISFSSANLTDLFVLGASYLLIRYVCIRDKSIDIMSALLAALFSLSYVVSFSYKFFDSAAFFEDNWYQVLFSGFCIVGYFAIFYFCIRMILLFVEEHSDDFVRKRLKQDSDQRILLISFSIIFLCWLPWIVSSYPASFSFDADRQLMQFFGEREFTAHHPPLSTSIMGALAVIGKYYVDIRFGTFLYILLQTIVGAWVFSVGVEKLYKAGIRLRYCLVIDVYYALSPLWVSFVQWYEKDLLYAELATLFLILLIDVVSSRQCSMKDAAAIMSVGVVASLLRNNGIYCVLPASILLAFYVQKHSRKAVWGTAIGIACVYLCIVKLIYPIGLGISDGSIAEALSIPFQQTARYISEHGDEITDEERASIDSVLDYSSLADIYLPKRSDPVKGTYKGDASKLSGYLGTWVSMFWKHPETYISATLNGAYGYLAPVQSNNEANRPNNWDDSFLKGMGLSKVAVDWDVNPLVYIRDLGTIGPLVKYLTMPGTYTWLVAFCAMVLLKKRKWGALIILVPAFMNILVCIASPLGYAIRYALPVVAAAPFLIGWTFLLARQRES